MPQPLPIVASYAMDSFYNNFRDASQFFDLKDFIFHCGATIADAYQQEAKAKYAELRAMKQEEVVTFPADWLLEQALKVERKDGETFAKLLEPVMGFSFDNQVIGIQAVLPLKPRDVLLKRTTQVAAWQNKLVPFTHTVFWYSKKDKIIFEKKGGCNVTEVTVSYIPAISDSMLVPDGVIRYTIDQTVSTMRQLVTGQVVKKSVDQNQNLVLEGEINKNSLK